MGVTKTISSNSIIQRIQTRFKPNYSSWKIDAKDWIEEAIKEIGYHTGFEYKEVRVKLKNYRASIPRQLQSIEAVFFNDIPLPCIIDKRQQDKYKRSFDDYSIANNDNTEELNNELKRLKELQELYLVSETDEILTALENSRQKVKTLVANFTFRHNMSSLYGDWYDIESGTIKSSISEGEIIVAGNCTMLDENGYPIAVDTQKYVMAIEWYIIYTMILGGWEHPNKTVDLDYAEKKAFYEYIPAAANEPKMPSRDRMDEFTQEWNSIKRDGSGVTLKSDM